MSFSSLKILPLLLVTIVGVGIISRHFYNNVLPYQYPNQWQPTEVALENGGQYDEEDELGVFHGMPAKSENYISDSSPSTNVLGDSDKIFKHIEVDLSKQMVYAFEGQNKVMEFLVSTGKWGRTPTGHFRIEYKTLAQKMSGGSRALGTYYYLPNVQFVQFFGNDEIPWSKGFSFHGTYWHEDFGTPMSHGCINMRNEDAEKLFYWTDPTMADKRIVRETGTPVFIYGTPPDS